MLGHVESGRRRNDKVVGCLKHEERGGEELEEVESNTRVGKRTGWASGTRLSSESLCYESLRNATRQRFSVQSISSHTADAQDLRRPCGLLSANARDITF